MSDARGAFVRYSDKAISPARMELVRRANVVVEEYERQGFVLTLRQLYYQFVSRGWLENQQRSYDLLGSVVSDGRLAGLISWEAIEDRTRVLRGTNTLEGPAEAVRRARAGYARDLWRGQEWRPEVWVEKDALVGVLEGVCRELRVDYFACRGYNSQSEQWRAGRRMANYVRRGQRPIVFHLGDHDPSGIDMTRDNQERLSLFSGTPVTVVRLALNYDQVERYAPPPNPAKMTDSRAADYVARFGSSSWELDALDPRTIRSLIREAVLRVRDEARWSLELAREAADLDALDVVAEGMGE